MISFEFIRRCIKRYPAKGYNRILSDLLVSAISLLEPDYNYCVCREESSILSLELDSHNKCIWSATTNSNISYWRIQPDEDITAEKFSGKSEQELAAPYREKPEYQYPGLPAIKQYKILPNRRYILTCDSNHQVAMYDVLKAEKIKIFSNEKYEDVLARYDHQMLYVPRKGLNLLREMLSILSRLIDRPKFNFLCLILSKLVLGRSKMRIFANNSPRRGRLSWPRRSKRRRTENRITNKPWSISARKFTAEMATASKVTRNGAVEARISCRKRKWFQDRN